jgi:hypothetical protein
MRYLIATSYIKFFLLILVISLFFDAFQDIKGKKKLFYTITVSTVFFAVMGFRYYGMGNDTISYINMFLWTGNTKSITEYVKATSIESGYLYYNYLLSLISDNPRILFVVTSAIVSFALGFFTYRNVNNPGVFFCMMVGLLQFDFLLSAMRQALATVFLLFAIDALIRKRRIFFVIFCLLAIQFHNAAWAMLLVSPIFWDSGNEQKEGNYLTYIIIFTVVVACSLFFDSVWNKLLEIFPKYDYYTDTERTDGEFRLALLLKIVVFIVIFVATKFYKHKPTENRALYNVGEKITLLHIAMYMIATSATALARLASVFSLFAIAHFSNSFKNNISSEKLTLLLLSMLGTFLYGLVIVILKTPEWQTTYPIILQFESIF